MEQKKKISVNISLDNQTKSSKNLSTLNDKTPQDNFKKKKYFDDIVSENHKDISSDNDKKTSTQSNDEDERKKKVKRSMFDIVESKDKLIDISQKQKKLDDEEKILESDLYNTLVQNNSDGILNPQKTLSIKPFKKTNYKRINAKDILKIVKEDYSNQQLIDVCKNLEILHFKRYENKSEIHVKKPKTK